MGALEEVVAACLVRHASRCDHHFVVGGDATNPGLLLVFFRPTRLSRARALAQSNDNVTHLLVVVAQRPTATTLHQQDCCDKCAAADDCAAGVLANNICYFKRPEELKQNVTKQGVGVCVRERIVVCVCASEYASRKAACQRVCCAS